MAKKRPPPTEEDLQVWRAHVSAEPLAVSRVSPAAERAPARVRRAPAIPAPPATKLLPQDQRALKRGKLAVEARVDLHGMTEAAAHRALASFIKTSAERGLRLVLVI